MKNPFFRLYLHIIAIFVTLMFVSLISEYLHNFFGDELCSGWIKNPNTGELENFFHYGGEHKTPELHWGYRHWLFFTMGICLFVIQIFRMVIFIDKTKFDNHE